MYVCVALQIIKGAERGNAVDVICSRFQKVYWRLRKPYEKNVIQIGRETRAVTEIESWVINQD